jgi:nicotinamide mononucleotide (NMN) deamidase PncC
MDPLVEEQVEKLHDSGRLAVLVVAGGGAQALTWLLSVPGASRTVLEAQVPYSASSLVRFLGYEPERVVSRETAEAMARCAYHRSLLLAPGGADTVGIGCTATIATDRPKMGPHGCFVSSWMAHGASTYGVVLVKGRRDRAGEDEVVSRVILRALSIASGVESRLPLGLQDSEGLKVTTTEHGDLLDSLLAGDIGTVTVRTDGGMAADLEVKGGVLPGSFDPLHGGHERLAEVAAAMLNADVSFELSVANVDKPMLKEHEVRTRVAQFAGKRPVVLTRAARFYEKAELFPGCSFVIGWDTAVRLVDARYHGGDRDKMLDALAAIRRAGCRFLVAGRADAGGFRTLEDVAVPGEFEDMFAPIPESKFRYDVSSTELRAAALEQG